MVYDNENPIFFEVFAGDEEMITHVVNLYNQKYRAIFHISGFEDRDGTLFASLLLRKGSATDIFQLGYFFGLAVQNQRNSGDTSL